MPSSLSRLLVVRGAAGSGRTLFSTQLEGRLWQRYHHGGSGVVPVFVSLADETRPVSEVVASVLSSCSMPQPLPADSRHRWLLVLDGVDGYLGPVGSVVVSGVSVLSTDVKVLLMAPKKSANDGYAAALTSLPSTFGTWEELAIAAFDADDVQVYSESVVAMIDGPTLVAKFRLGGLMATPLHARVVREALPLLTKHFRRDFGPEVPGFALADVFAMAEVRRAR